jgi:hypothetical protein
MQCLNVYRGRVEEECEGGVGLERGARESRGCRGGEGL